MSIINRLNNRILEISIKHKLSHLGSCFTSLPIIYDIYKKIINNEFHNLNPSDDKFVLSNGHAGLALYVVLEHFYGEVNAEELLIKHGIHPERDLDNNIHVSTGSLGLGITIACGMALANKNKKIYCLISDGECAEGSVWEALRFSNKLPNLEIHCNANGVCAYDAIDVDMLEKNLHSFNPNVKVHRTNVHDIISFDSDLQAHYKMADENMKIKEV